MTMSYKKMETAYRQRYEKDNSRDKQSIHKCRFNDGHFHISVFRGGIFI